MKVFHFFFNFPFKLSFGLSVRLLVVGSACSDYLVDVTLTIFLVQLAASWLFFLSIEYFKLGCVFFNL